MSKPFWIVIKGRSFFRFFAPFLFNAFSTSHPFCIRYLSAKCLQTGSRFPVHFVAVVEGNSQFCSVKEKKHKKIRKFSLAFSRFEAFASITRQNILYTWTMWYMRHDQTSRKYLHLILSKMNRQSFRLFSFCVHTIFVIVWRAMQNRRKFQENCYCFLPANFLEVEEFHLNKASHFSLL